MRAVFLIVVILGTFVNPPVVGAQTPLAVSGADAKCLIAGEFPQLDAVVAPPDKVAKVRLYFKSALSPDWFYVDATNTAGVLKGTLPKPNVDAGPVSYYFEAIGSDMTVANSVQVDARVVPNAGDCDSDKAAAIVPTGPATVFGVSGAAAPVGFSGLGAVAAGSAVGAGVAGGVAVTTIAVGAGVVAAGVATGVVVSNNNDDDDDDNPNPPPVSGTK